MVDLKELVEFAEDIALNGLITSFHIEMTTNGGASVKLSIDQKQMNRQEAFVAADKWVDRQKEQAHQAFIADKLREEAKQSELVQITPKLYGVPVRHSVPVRPKMSADEKLKAFMNISNEKEAQRKAEEAKFPPARFHPGRYASNAPVYYAPEGEVVPVATFDTPFTNAIKEAETSVCKNVAELDERTQNYKDTAPREANHPSQPSCGCYGLCPYKEKGLEVDRRPISSGQNL